MNVVVVGGGIIGLTSAYEFLKAGHDVTVMEAERVGRGASHGNACKIVHGECAPVPAPGVLPEAIRWMLRADSPVSVKPTPAPDYVKFLLSMAKHCNERDFRQGLEMNLRLGDDANSLMDAYRADGLDFEMNDTTCVLAFEKRETYDSFLRQSDIWAEFGIEPTRLVGDAVHEVEPALSDHIRYGLHVTQDRVIEPDSLIRALTAAVTGLGGTIVEDASVTGFVTQGGGADRRRVTHVRATGGRDYSADTVVLAGGVATRGLARMLGATVPVHPGKGYSIDYSPAPVTLQHSVALEDAHMVVTPLNGFTRIAGTMEFGSYDANIDEVRVEAIRRSARRGLRDWEAGEAASGERTPWAGLRPMTPDGLPVVGQLGGWSNAYVSSGHCMLGLTQAPSTARVLVDLVEGTSSRLSRRDLELLSPDRFGPGGVGSAFGRGVGAFGGAGGAFGKNVGVAGAGIRKGAHGAKTAAKGLAALATRR